MKKCKRCGSDFEPKNPKGKFCSDKCRVYWNRGNNAPKTSETAQKSKNTENSGQYQSKEKESKKAAKSFMQLLTEAKNSFEPEAEQKFRAEVAASNLTPGQKSSVYSKIKSN